MRRRRAFSLAELIVSIGILVLMFSLAGQVFHLTVRSTGQALAVTDVRALLREFEASLREDLRYAQAGESLIVIQSNPVNAYWTEESKASGVLTTPGAEFGLPRADVLMLFTTRPGRSYVVGGITSNLQQVVYSHADLGDYELPSVGAGAQHVFRAGVPAFPTATTASGGEYPAMTPSMVPADSWHLARRGVLMVPHGTSPIGFSDDTILRSEADVLIGFDPEEWLLTPRITDSAGNPVERYLPRIFSPIAPFELPAVPFARSQLDETPPAQKAKSLGHYFLPRCASFKVEWSLDPHSEFVDGRLDGLRDILWFDQGAEDPLKPLAEAAIDPRNPKVVRDRLYSLLHTPMLRAYPLVNWDEYSLETRFRGANYPPPVTPTDWMGPDGRPNIVVFRARVPRQVDANGKIVHVPDDVFPAALRITIDLYDSEKRLEKPTRHVMIVPVGS